MVLFEMMLKGEGLAEKRAALEAAVDADPNFEEGTNGLLTADGTLLLTGSAHGDDLVAVPGRVAAVVEPLVEAEVREVRARRAAMFGDVPVPEKVTA